MQHRFRRLASLAGLLAVGILTSTAGASAPIEIQGQVLAPGRRPLARGEVVLLSTRDARTVSLASLEGSGRSEPEPVVRALSDGDGWFRLAAPQPGFWTVVATAPGHLAMAVDLSPLLDDLDLPPVELPVPGEFTVRLLDRDGRAMPGGYVIVDAHRSERDPSGPPDLSPWYPHRQIASADPAGVARLETAAGNTYLKIAAIAGTRLGQASPQRGVADFTLKLRHELAPARLLDAEGRPVSGAALALTVPRVLLATSNELGEMGFPVGEGHLPFGVEKDGTWLPLNESRKALAQSIAAGVVHLAAIETLELEVIDELTRKPISGAFVELSGEQHRTDAQGRLPLPADTHFPLRLNVHAPGYVHGHWLRLERSPDGSAPLSVALAPACELSGRVLGEDGRPVARAQLTLIHARGASARELLDNATAWALPTASLRTRADGSFRIPMLEPAGDYVLEIREPRFVPQLVEVPPFDLQRPPRSLEIRLEKGYSVVGQLLDDRRRPIAGAEVLLSPDPQRTAPRPEHRARRDWRTTTTADGRFEALDLDPGAWTLLAIADGFTELLQPSIEISTSRRRADLGQLLLAPGITFAGKVTDPDGAPVAGAKVEVRRRDLEELSIFGTAAATRKFPQLETNDEGRFELEHLPPSAVLAIEVKHGGFQPKELVSIRPEPGQTLRISLVPAGTLRAEVIDAQGSPVAAARVRLRRPLDFSRATDGLRREGTTDASGHFTFESLPPGEAEVWAQTSDAVALPHLVVIDASGEPREARLQLQPAVSLAGRVVDQEGRPVSQARLMTNLTEPEALGRWFHTLDTERDGRFAVPGLGPPGSYELTVSARGFDDARRELSFETAGPHEIEIVLEGGGAGAQRRVSGRVVDPDGGTVARASVHLLKRPDDWSRVWASSRRDGSFQLTTTGPGSYQLVAEKRGFARGYSAPFEIAEGDLEGLEIRLTNGGIIEGRVVDTDLERLRPISIEVIAPEGSRLSTLVGSDGSFRLEHVGVGRWSLVAETGSSRYLHPEPIVLEAEGEVVTIELRPDLEP